ncbi:MAG: hypothetical protein WC429_13550, partial [Verrucomicrobiia bacterium]
MKSSIESAPGSARARAVPRRVNLAEAIVCRRLRWGEWLVERGVFLVSLSAILMIFLIFVFVGREALPVALGRTSNARNQKPIAAAEIPGLAPDKLATYLGVPVADLKTFDA